VLERLVCGDIKGLKPGSSATTLLLNDQGGIVDDLIVGRPADPSEQHSLYVVVNASTKDDDYARIAAAGEGRLTIERQDQAGCALWRCRGRRRPRCWPG
jgi:aminomethyltransferase